MTKIQLVEENVDPNNFEDKNLPTDVHLVTFTVDGNTQVDAVRAYAMVDVFDDYYDRISDKGKVLKIESGFGKIKPRLYGKIKTEED
tara:strand:+ start:374 stop:634 length:261 start_codon:yes stop_codon:yes gene_type:complete